ncbi:MAG TPA: tripartite tricarboxylate transporter substrate binding protein [Hyphomicrobiaceae bacterium]|jgi:tripartite-type tricarboxylate transporter receptor subunit TctC|nr:tripartite tricarboxylate transporter substrate binding protein [Hyphomicrobiaceae bacterium]
MLKRQIACAAAVLALAAFLAVGAGAEEKYPTRTVKFIVPLTLGTPPAVALRVIAEKLQATWGQPVVLESRLGASQNIAADALAKAEPDGYTLLFTPPAPLVIAKWMYKKLSFDPDTFTPVSVPFGYSMVLTIGPKVPATTLEELIAYAKANPGKLNHAHPGVTSVPYLTVRALMHRTGMDMTHVAYQKLTTQGQLDLFAGLVHVILDPFVTGAIEQHLAGKLRIVATTSDTREPLLPDVPTISEVLPGFEMVEFYAITAPPKTPPALAEKISRDIAEALRSPDVVERLRALGYNKPVGGSPADLTKLIRNGNERWRDLIESLGMTKSQ